MKQNRNQGRRGGDPRWIEDSELDKNQDLSLDRTSVIALDLWDRVIHERRKKIRKQREAEEAQ